TPTRVPHDCPGEGAVSLGRGLAPCSTQCGHPGAHGDGPPVRGPAERRGHHRDHLRPAGSREARRGLDPEQGLADRAGRRSGADADLHRDESPGRSLVGLGRPEDPLRVSARQRVDSSGTPGRGLWGDAFRRLRRNTGATVGGGVFLLIVLVAVTAPLLAPDDPIRLNVSESLEPPGGRHWLGTDQFGRDVLSRIIYGARISVAMGFVAVTISVVAGSVLGLLSGFYRGTVDLLVMRLVDVMLAFPGI